MSLLNALMFSNVPLTDTAFDIAFKKREHRERLVFKQNLTSAQWIRLFKSDLHNEYKRTLMYSTNLGKEELDVLAQSYKLFTKGDAFGKQHPYIGKLRRQSFSSEQVQTLINTGVGSYVADTIIEFYDRKSFTNATFAKLLEQAGIVGKGYWFLTASKNELPDTKVAEILPVFSTWVGAQEKLPASLLPLVTQFMVKRRDAVALTQSDRALYSFIASSPVLLNIEYQNRFIDEIISQAGKGVFGADVYRRVLTNPCVTRKNYKRYSQWLKGFAHKAPHTMQASVVDTILVEVEKVRFEHPDNLTSWFGEAKTVEDVIIHSKYLATTPDVKMVKGRWEGHLGGTALKILQDPLCPPEVVEQLFHLCANNPGNHTSLRDSQAPVAVALRKVFADHGFMKTKNVKPRETGAQSKVAPETPFVFRPTDCVPPNTLDLMLNQEVSPWADAATDWLNEELGDNVLRWEILLTIAEDSQDSPQELLNRISLLVK